MKCTKEFFCLFSLGLRFKEGVPSSDVLKCIAKALAQEKVEKVTRFFCILMDRPYDNVLEELLEEQQKCECCVLVHFFCILSWVKDVVVIDPHEGRGRRVLPKRVGHLYVS